MSAANRNLPRIRLRNIVLALGLSLASITILMGAWLGWDWIRSPLFRYLHLAAIVFVAGEALVGMACPLTVWEDVLRGGVRVESFVGRWLQRLLFYRAPEWVFTSAYAAWAVATVLTLVLVPPRRKAG